jgi:hypothetical protein
VRHSIRLGFCVATVVLLTATATLSASGAGSGANYQPLPAKVRHEITSVPRAVLKWVGSPRHDTPPKVKRTTKLRHHGKPELAYLIAEWCPLCASESWSVAVAVSRFGSLRHLTTLNLDATDAPPNLKTVSLRHSTFHSRYLAFDPVVVEDSHHNRVDKVPPKIRKVWMRGNAPGFPWLDFGGRALLEESSFNPKVIEKESRAQIAAHLRHPRHRDAKLIDGAANQLTAAICVMTKDHPATICKSKPIAKIEASLPHGSK